MKLKQRYVGLDVHKDTITIATAEGSREGEWRVYGQVSSDLRVLEKALRKIRITGAMRTFFVELETWCVQRARAGVPAIRFVCQESRRAVLWGLDTEKTNRIPSLLHLWVGDLLNDALMNNAAVKNQRVHEHIFRPIFRGVEILHHSVG